MSFVWLISFIFRVCSFRSVIVMSLVSSGSCYGGYVCFTKSIKIYGLLAYCVMCNIWCTKINRQSFVLLLFLLPLSSRNIAYSSLIEHIAHTK